MEIPLDSVVLSKPSSGSCHASGAAQCMSIYKAFATPENNEGEGKKNTLLSSLCLFASL